MDIIKRMRKRQGLSQRALAARAGVSFRAIQLIEAERSNARLSSLDKIAIALGRPKGGLRRAIETYLGQEAGSIQDVSRKISEEGERTWSLWLFDFVDAFRRHPDSPPVEAPPVSESSPRMRALLASTVETLCEEQGIAAPWWRLGIGPLETPWFVSGIENLKAMALVESPAHFRKRNIFVLSNFLDRA